MNLKVWTWPGNSRDKRESREIKRQIAFTRAVTEALNTVTIDHKVTHSPRPPAPRPFQLVVTYVMSDGQEYRTFCPMNGQAEWQENPPHWVMQNAEKISTIRYSFRYNDGGMM